MNEPNPMVVSDPLAAFEREGMVKLIAPAKTNLFLGIGALRADGYHEALTVMHALTLHDVLHMDHIPVSEGGLQIEVLCYAREGLEPLTIPAESNIVTKAVRLLAAKIGRAEDESISVRIEKHIPYEAGLGGGSSDAAAALLGAAQFWDVAHDAPEVEAAAQELGSDVRFFLQGGCACLSGTGEVFEHVLEPMKHAAVLIKPAGGVSTPEAYRAFDAAPIPVPDEVRKQALAAMRAEDVPLFNNLARASESLFPELADVHAWLLDQEGVEDALLCGSGSATFALCADFSSACKICAEAQARGWWARTTNFSAVRAAVVPKSG